MWVFGGVLFYYSVIKDVLNDYMMQTMRILSRTNQYTGMLTRFFLTVHMYIYNIYICTYTYRYIIYIYRDMQHIYIYICTLQEGMRGVHHLGWFKSFNQNMLAVPFSFQNGPNFSNQFIWIFQRTTQRLSENLVVSVSVSLAECDKKQNNSIQQTFQAQIVVKQPVMWGPSKR